jgi:hypothetical protein
MKPEITERLTWFLILVGAVLGVVAVVLTDWIILGAMILVVIGQGLNLRRMRRGRAGTTPARPT